MASLVPLKGIDVSSNNGVINWGAVAADQISFALIKRSEGTGYADEYFDRNWAGAGAHQLLRGAYHFCRPEQGNPLAEAAWFLSLLPERQVGELLAMDIETPDRYEDQSAYALTLGARVSVAAGHQPLLYSYVDYIVHCLTSPDLVHFPLWAAAWGKIFPAPVGPWQDAAIWQYASTGTVAGIGGPVDLNVTNRTLDALKLLGKRLPVWHARHTCALKPPPHGAPPMPNHMTASEHTVFGGDIVQRLGLRVTVKSPITGQDETWVEVDTIGKDGKRYTGWLLEANLYST